MVVALRVYVALFAFGLFAAAVILPIVEPRVACSDVPCRGTVGILASVVPALLVAVSALIAAIGVQARRARWLAAVVLSIGVLRYGYVVLAFERVSTADALLMVVTTSPFMLGPLFAALWLCGRDSSSSGTPGRMKAR